MSPDAQRHAHALRWYRNGRWRAHGLTKAGRKNGRILVEHPETPEHARAEMRQYLAMRPGQVWDRKLRARQKKANRKSYAPHGGPTAGRKTRALPPRVTQVVRGGLPGLGKNQ